MSTTRKRSFAAMQCAGSARPEFFAGDGDRGIVYEHMRVHVMEACAPVRAVKRARVARAAAPPLPLSVSSGSVVWPGDGPHDAVAIVGHAVPFSPAAAMEYRARGEVLFTPGGTTDASVGHGLARFSGVAPGVPLGYLPGWHVRVGTVRYVPQVFWCSLSMVFWLRVPRADQQRLPLGAMVDLWFSDTLVAGGIQVPTFGAANTRSRHTGHTGAAECLLQGSDAGDWFLRGLAFHIPAEEVRLRAYGWARSMQGVRDTLAEVFGWWHATRGQYLGRETYLVAAAAHTVYMAATLPQRALLGAGGASSADGDVDAMVARAAGAPPRALAVYRTVTAPRVGGALLLLAWRDRHSSRAMLGSHASSKRPLYNTALRVTLAPMERVAPPGATAVAAAAGAVAASAAVTGVGKWALPAHLAHVLFVDFATGGSAPRVPAAGVVDWTVYSADGAPMFWGCKSYRSSTSATFQLMFAHGHDDFRARFEFAPHAEGPAVRSLCQVHAFMGTTHAVRWVALDRGA